MHPKSPKWLDDIVRSCEFIYEHTDRMSLDDYLENQLVRLAVERNLTIIGEAASRLRAIDPETASGITDIHQIIGLRNRLVHGYDDEVDNRIVWRSVRQSIPMLRDEAEALLSAEDSQ